MSGGVIDRERLARLDTVAYAAFVGMAAAGAAGQLGAPGLASADLGFIAGVWTWALLRIERHLCADGEAL